MLRSGMLSRRRGALLLTGLTLLVVAWMGATQPFAAPDEASHYLRALTITNGHILGPRIPYPSRPGLLTPPQLAWIDRDTTAVEVPAKLSPPNVACTSGKPDIRGRCFEAVANGNFPPLAYFLPAVALGASHDANTGLWLSRIASALPSIGFLLLAFALLWDGSAWSVFGLLLAATPMVLFTSSILNSSGPEITACLAFSAAGLRLVRRPPEAGRWAWAALLIAGAVAILAWPLGLAFVAGNVLVFALLLGRGDLVQFARERTRPLLFTGATLLAATALSLIYMRSADLGAHKLGISPFIHGLRLGFGQLAPVLRDGVGTFGSLTVHLPSLAYWIWWLLVIALLLAAASQGRRSERSLIASVTVLALLFPVLLYAWFDRFTGFGLQGREVLPALMLIPVAAGEVLYRHRKQFSPSRLARALLCGALATIAVFQAYAWWSSARVAAGVPHAVRFYAHPIWTPPGGWLPWIMSAVIGTVALLTFAALEARSGLVPARMRAADAGVLSETHL